MKYMRKTPVEAIQWNGHNLNEVSEFISHATKSYSMWNDSFDNLDMTYSFQKGRTSRAVIPLFGWVVREGKTFQFYKDSTFRKTFKAAEEDSKGIGMTDTINKAFDDIFKGFHGVPRKDIVDALKEKAREANIERVQRMADLLRRDSISREESEKQLVDGVTFESVLDKMKELHAKKNKDYGDAFHKSFVEFGPTAGVVRMNDKMERVKSLVKNGKTEVKDESLMDSLEDLACYAVMLYVELIKYRVLATCALIGGAIASPILLSIVLPNPWRFIPLCLLLTGIFTVFAYFTYLWFENID